MSILESITDDHGVVIKKNNGMYWVHTTQGILTCTLAGNLESQGQRRDGRRPPHNDLRSEQPVAGDLVGIRPAGRGTGLIVSMDPRRNRLARRSAVPMPGVHPYVQVIAANVDLVVPVFAAADPAPRWNLLDRFLVSAESLELPALVCITKLDLAQDRDGQPGAELVEAVAEYRRAGYAVHLTSTLASAGIDSLRVALAGKVSVLVGKSGVGKTSLLNALQPGLGQRVGAVNQVTGKGRHTTSTAELYPLDFGGALVDTPGIREFGLWDVEQDDLALFFPEMRRYLGHCRFGLDCAHSDEPGCAVRKAVMAGEISPRRYYSYMKLREEGYAND